MAAAPKASLSRAVLTAGTLTSTVLAVAVRAIDTAENAKHVGSFTMAAVPSPCALPPCARPRAAGSLTLVVEGGGGGGSERQRRRNTGLVWAGEGGKGQGAHSTERGGERCSDNVRLAASRVTFRVGCWYYVGSGGLSPPQTTYLCRGGYR